MSTPVLRTLRATWPLMLGVIPLMIRKGLLATLPTLRGRVIGVMAGEIGGMQACHPLGALAGCAVTPRMAVWIGHVRAFGALASLCSVAAVVHLMRDDLITWSAMRLLAGFCFPGLDVVSERWLNDSTGNEHRGARLSACFIAQTVGATAGQAIAGAPDPSGVTLFAINTILISRSLVAVLTAGGDAPRISAPERLSIAAAFRLSPMGLLGDGVAGRGAERGLSGGVRRRRAAHRGRAGAVAGRSGSLVEDGDARRGGGAVPDRVVVGSC